MSFVGGKLKLKGVTDLPGVKKKKKKIKHIDANTLAAEKKAADDSLAMPPPPPATSNKEQAQEEVEDKRTEAEKRFEEHMMKYEAERLKKAAGKSHRDRVKELNEKLSTMTEHHDIPRISYSYM